MGDPDPSFGESREELNISSKDMEFWRKGREAG
jgi:hypothetical protein